MRLRLHLAGFPGSVARVPPGPADLSLFEHKFQRLTGDAKTATELAALFYLAIVGSHQALSRPSSSPRAKAYLKGIIARLMQPFIGI